MSNRFRLSIHFPSFFFSPLFTTVLVCMQIIPPSYSSPSLSGLTPFDPDSDPWSLSMILTKRMNELGLTPAGVAGRDLLLRKKQDTTYGRKCTYNTLHRIIRGLQPSPHLYSFARAVNALGGAVVMEFGDDSFEMLPDGNWIKR